MRELARGTLTLFVALSILNASNYLFHVAVSRLLGPDEYGALAGLLAVIMVLSVPLGVAQTVVAKRSAKLRAEGRGSEINELVAGTTRALGWFGAAGGLALVTAAPILAWFLHTEAGAAVLLGPYWFLSLILSVPLGVLQGRLRFGAFAATALGGVAVRLAAGIGLVWAGFGVTGAIVGTVLAQVASLALALVFSGIGMAWRRTRSTLKILRGEFGSALVALGAFWLFAEIDVILARRYLDPTEAGFYASAGLVGRALLFLPGAISIAALPRFAEAPNAEEASRRLRLAISTVGILVLLAYPALVLLRGPVVALAFGEAFRPAADLIPLLSAGMGLMAVINLLVFFHVAEGTRAHRITLAAIGLEAVLISVFHESPEQIGWIVFGVALVAAAFTYHSAIAASRWRPANHGSPAGLDALSASPSVDVSVVLPCHNAGHGLPSVLRTLRQELAQVESWEIIVVSDGSTDETVRIAREYANENLVLLEEPLHVGKGQALRAGLGRARGRYVAFMDADGDVDPRAIRPALALTDLYEPDIVLGSKRHPLSEVQYPVIRRAMSWTYHKLCRLLFRVKVRDTQTGFKLIRRDVLAAVLPRMLEKRYAFDLEFLVVARSLGYTRVFEIPIRIDYRFESQVASRTVFRIVLDTLAIFYRRYVLGTYRPPLVAERSPQQPPLFTANGGTRSLRILFLNWRDIRNPDAGGAEVVTHEVGKRWVAQGHEVALYTSRFRGSPKTETIDGVRIRRMGRLRNGSFHLRVQRELARLQGFDVVIDEINTIPFFTPLWKRRLPTTVALIHQLAADVLDAELPKPLAALGKRLEPRMLRLYSDVPVVTVSDSTRKDLEHVGLNHVQVISNGRDDPPQLEGVGKEPAPTFMFVGRLAANKQPNHALDAFRLIRVQLPGSRLWIVGEGPEEGRIRRSLPDGAEMLGHLPRDELYRRMARAHCLLVPSVREGWGLVVIEANSVGTPVVGYDVPGLRDTIHDGVSGLLAKGGDCAHLAEQAVLLLNDHRKYRSFCDSATEWARSFSWESSAAEFESLLQNLVRIDRREPETDIKALSIAAEPV